jgi:hypothetical protein
VGVEAGEQAANGRWRISVAATLVLVPVLFGLLSHLLGQTADWDLLNYHLYNPHAWLNGRWAIDVAPAQVQSFHNPLLHLPYYLGFTTIPHGFLAALVGLLQALLILPLYKLGQKLLLPLGIQPLMVALLAAMGLMGPIFLSELGTDFGDSLLAIPVLTALVLLIPTTQAESSDKRVLLHTAVAGLLAGAAAGLKLAFAFYLPALAAAAVVAHWNRGVLMPVLLLIVSASIGLASTTGWWMVHLWQEYANPLFPYFNDWFQSPWAASVANRDPRFVSAPVAEQMLKPLTAMFDYRQVLELSFRDFRPVLMILGLLALPLFLWRERSKVKLSRPLLAVLAFLLTAWIGWSFVFGYYRYTLAIEALMPIALPALFLPMLRPGKMALVAMAWVLLLSQLLVKIPDWGRVNYGQLRVDLRQLHDSDLLIAAGRDPVGFVALQLPDQVPFIRIASNLYAADDEYGLAARARAAIHSHAGRLFALTTHDEMVVVGAQIRQLGLYMNVYECVSIMDDNLPSLADRLWLCPVGRFNPGRVWLEGR